MIHSIYRSAPSGAPGRVLLVMLPGMGMAAEEFAAHGFVSAVHDRRLAVDIVAAQPDLDIYLDGKIAGRLHDAVIAPAMACGYRRLWLLGISVGGMGAVLYTAGRSGRRSISATGGTTVSRPGSASWRSVRRKSGGRWRGRPRLGNLDFALASDTQPTPVCSGNPRPILTPISGRCDASSNIIRRQGVEAC